MQVQARLLHDDVYDYDYEVTAPIGFAVAVILPFAGSLMGAALRASAPEGSRSVVSPVVLTFIGRTLAQLVHDAFHIMQHMPIDGEVEDYDPTLDVPDRPN